MECPACLTTNPSTARRCRRCRAALLGRGPGPWRPGRRRWRVQARGQAIVGRQLRSGRLLLAVATVVGLAVAAGSRHRWVALPAGALPMAAALAAASLAGRAQLLDRLGVLGASGRAWVRHGVTPTARFVELDQLTTGPGGRPRLLRFRGTDPRLDEGDQLQAVVVPLGRARPVLWARQLGSARRWVASTLVWAAFVLAAALDAAVQLWLLRVG